MTQSVLKKILFSRRLFELGRESLNQSSDIAQGVGVCLMQDAVEMYLIAISEHLDITVDQRTTFDQYLRLIDIKIDPIALPFRSRLLALNKLRVNSKHSGIIPERSEVQPLIIVVREFFSEVSESVLNANYSAISLLDLVRSGTSKDFLKVAEQALDEGKYDEVLINCRKAIYVRFESWYDASVYNNDEDGALGFHFRRVPYFARNKDYLDKNVLDPTEFIILDYNELELDLIKAGVDSVAFWNVRRLTPEVFEYKDSSKWVVKHDLKVMEEEGIRGRADYVFDATVSIFVAADQKRAAIKSPENRTYFINLVTDEVPVYKKADEGSDTVGTTPKGLQEIKVDHCVPGFQGDGIFWHTLLEVGDSYLWGYIKESDVDREKD